MSTYNVQIEAVRDVEYPNLAGRTYLDHGGTTIPCKSLCEASCADLIQNLYGNPHSNSAPSRLSTARVDKVRDQVLEFFHADPQRFDVVFTANSTAAIRLVGECLRDYAHTTSKSTIGLKRPKSFRYSYHRDGHTSLVGLRELGDGKDRCLASGEEVEGWMSSGLATTSQPILFAYPGQSNMTGRRLPLSWPKLLRHSRSNAYTLLDAAALSTCSQLELDRDEPDFTAVSFYKIFGMPDLGALIVRKGVAHLLQKRRYFGGGTVEMVIVLDGAWHARKRDSIHDQLEEGTLAFHSIIALGHAITIHKRLYTSMAEISAYTAWLGHYAYESMMAMRHPNGAPVFIIYKDEEAVYGDVASQGATVAFNILSETGTLEPYTRVEKAADKEDIYVRSGGLCNPGGVATYLKWGAQDLKSAYAHGHRCDKPMTEVHGRATGVVRISMGAMSLKRDIDHFLAFVQEKYIFNRDGAGEPWSNKEPRPLAASSPASESDRSGQGSAAEEKKSPTNSRVRHGWLWKIVGFCTTDATKTI